MPRLPTEVWSAICTTFDDDNYNVIAHHRRKTDIYNLSLVSHEVRHAALGVMWKTLGFGSSAPDILERLSLSLCEEQSRNPTGRARFIRVIRVFFDADFGVDEPSAGGTLGIVHYFRSRFEQPEQPTCFLALTRILRLLSSNQLQKLHVWLGESYHTIHGRQSSNLADLFFYTLALNVKNIQLEPCSMYTAAILDQMPDSVRSLSLLSYTDNTADNSTIKAHSPKNLGRITSLPNLRDIELKDLSGPNLSDQFIHGLRSWRNLQTLKLHRSCFGDDVTDAIAGCCPAMKTLEIVADVSEEEPEGYPSEAPFLRIIDGCPLLERLVLGSIGSLTDVFLAHCASRARGLCVLEIKGSPMTGAGVVDVSGWKELQVLVIESSALYDWRLRETRKSMDTAFIKLVREQCTMLKHRQIGEQIVPHYFYR
ncbi:hypothetical protein BC938DRAFT_474633 [Jimgerdemannia flammicorona]|uniref:F-box domain-containing protein n=1 Tax=Jimgerdemannia flammicorona TaxID=994334 RepID=A0A433Q1U4_9FUNG|nr:hypothetical protein BC938DRAFT_474633 [Jimgerdemannia flammicorona]